ncbi:MAG: transposase [Fuerstiella sp.]
MSRKTESAESVTIRKTSAKFTHGDLLRKALTWAVNDRMFANVRLHGNTRWNPKQIVILAVLWVWSDKSTLVRAFIHARRLSLAMFGNVGVTTYQGLKPQMWITLIWHMGLKMPWTGKTGASNSSERHHLMEMLKTETFPENTLFCGDAGFVGYELWNSILDAGHNFLMRVGANVRLLTDLECIRQRDGIVCVWPNAAVRAKQPPIVLRLIQVQNERGTMSLVTNVLSQRQLSNSRIARGYAMRWGIELQFRSFKQMFGRGLLHSRTSECSYVEMDWSLAGLWMVQLFAVKEQIRVDRPPDSSSVSLSLAVIQNAMDMCNEDALNGRVLNRELSNAVKDEYVRVSSKTARYKPNKKHKPSVAQPVLLKATDKQKEACREIQQTL